MNQRSDKNDFHVVNNFSPRLRLLLELLRLLPPVRKFLLAFPLPCLNYQLFECLKNNFKNKLLKYIFDIFLILPDMSSRISSVCGGPPHGPSGAVSGASST